MKKSLLFLAVSLAVLPKAHAYIDPGSGMAFVSGIGSLVLGFFAVAFGGIALTFKKWIGFVKHGVAALRGKSSHQESVKDAS